MGRPSSLKRLANGDVVARVRIPRPLWLIAQWHAEHLGIDAIHAIELALASLGERLAKTGRAPRWISEVLGPSWERGLREVQQLYAGIIRSGGPTIDVDRLHRTKSRSGFVGVTRCAHGYVATGRISTMSNDQKQIGIFDTPEEAAWARSQYYEKMNLPYGQWEIDVERWRSNQNHTGSDADLLRELQAYNESVGLGHLNQLPGLPKNPSTIPPGNLDMLPAERVPTIAELTAENDRRDRELRERALRAADEAERDPKPDNALDDTPSDDDGDEIECPGCHEILARDFAHEHTCKWAPASPSIARRAFQRLLDATAAAAPREVDDQPDGDTR